MECCAGSLLGKKILGPRIALDDFKLAEIGSGSGARRRRKAHGAPGKAGVELERIMGELQLGKIFFWRPLALIGLVCRS